MSILLYCQPIRPAYPFTLSPCHLVTLSGRADRFVFGSGLVAWWPGGNSEYLQLSVQAALLTRELRRDEPARGEQIQEDVECLGIELSPSPGAQSPDNFVVRQGSSVG